MICDIQDPAEALAPDIHRQRSLRLCIVCRKGTTFATRGGSVLGSVTGTSLWGARGAGLGGGRPAKGVNRPSES